jgi:hypothetical protein
VNILLVTATVGFIRCIVLHELGNYADRGYALSEVTTHRRKTILGLNCRMQYSAVAGHGNFVIRKFDESDASLPVSTLLCTHCIVVKL